MRKTLNPDVAQTDALEECEDRNEAIVEHAGNLALGVSATQTNALLLICEAIVESVAVAGTHGVGGGIIYLAMMSRGCSLDQFQQIMSALVSSGRLAKRGETYFVSARLADFNRDNDGGAQ